MTEVRPLRAYAEVDLGRQRSPKHERGDHLVPYLRAADVKDGRLELDDVKEMNFTPLEQKQYRLEPGDVLVTEGSGSLSAVGASAVWDGEINGAVCFQNTLLRLRPREGTDARYLAWWCRYAFADGLFASLATGANIHHLSATGLRSLAVTYLPLAEQRAIADFLDTETARIDALITKKGILASALRQREITSVIELLGGLGQDPLGRPERLPDDWGWIRARYLFPEVTVGVVVNPSTYFVDAGVPFVHGKDIRDGKISTGALKFLDPKVSRTTLRKSLLRAGDMLAMRVGEPGRAALVTADLAGGNCASVLLFRQSSKLRGDLAVAYMNTPGGRRQVEAFQYGAAQGVLNVSDALELRFPVPPMEAQIRIAKQLAVARDRNTAVLTALGRQIDLLREHRQALITAAVTGQVDVPGVAA